VSRGTVDPDGAWSYHSSMAASDAVRAFRERFTGVRDAERNGARRSCDDERLAECLELHGLALWMDVERAMRDAGAARPEDVVAEVNRRRLAGSPMPSSLAERARARRVAP